VKIGLYHGVISVVVVVGEVEDVDAGVDSLDGVAIMALLTIIGMKDQGHPLTVLGLIRMEYRIIHSTICNLHTRIPITIRISHGMQTIDRTDPLDLLEGAVAN